MSLPSTEFNPTPTTTATQRQHRARIVCLLTTDRCRANRASRVHPIVVYPGYPSRLTDTITSAVDAWDNPSRCKKQDLERPEVDQVAVAVDVERGEASFGF